MTKASDVPLVFERAAPAQRPHRSPSRANHRLGIVLLSLLALFPLPLGSNRPIFWAVWGIVIGGIGFVYFLSLRLSSSGLLVKPLRLPELVIPYVALIVFLVVQTLPLGSIGYPTVRTLRDGLTVSTGTISVDPATTFLALLQLASYGLLAYLSLQVGYRSSRANGLIGCLFLVVIGYAVFGLAVLGLGSPQSGDERIATGPFVNRNNYATYLAFGVAIGVALIVGRLPSQGDGNRLRGVAATLLVVLGILVIGVALVATQSRMGFAAGLVGASAVMLVASVGRRAGVGAWLGFAAALLTGCIGLLAFNGEGLLERLGALESDGDARFELYQQVWHMIMASPYLGYGGDTFEAAFPLFHQPPVSPDVVWNKAHSTYLALWSELGLVAGSLPLFMTGAATLRLLPLRRRRAAAPVELAAIGVVAVAGVHSLVDFSLEIQAVAFIFVSVVSIAIGANLGESEVNRRDA